MKTASRRRRHSRTRPLVEWLERRELLASAPGALDPSFAAGRGFSINEASAAPTSLTEQITGDTITGVFRRTDGKVVVAAVVSEASLGSISFSTTTYSLVLERFNADGSPDATFGQGGKLTVAVPFGTTYTFSGPGGKIGEAVAMQPDGKILAGGSEATGSIVSSPNSTFAVIRLNADGSLDKTYGQDGVAAYPAGFQTAAKPGLTSVGAMAIQPDGRVVLVGTSEGGMGGTSTSFAAVRLNADGSLDTSFGTGGTTLIGPLAPQADFVAIQPDGGIVAAGLSSNDGYQACGVVRLEANGKPDTTFGGPTASGGVLVLPLDPSGYQSVNADGLAIEGDNKIVISTDEPSLSITGSPINELRRLDADGTADTSFGANGLLRPAVAGPVAIQDDGKIVVGGTVTSFRSVVVPGFHGRSVFAVARFNADGSADAGFGNTSTPGLARYNFGAEITQVGVTALAIQPDGNILLAGASNTLTSAGTPSAPTYFGLARALGAATTGAAALPASPTSPASFDGTGRTDVAVYLPSLGAFVYRPQFSTADQTIPFGIAGAGQTIPAAADYEGLGATQFAAYLPSQGLYAIRPADGGPDQVFPFGVAGAGRSIPVPADYDGDGKADVAVYLPSQGVFGVRPSSGGPDEIIPFGFAGTGGTIPAPGDYDGDGKADIAAYLPALGAFAIRPSSGGPDEIIPFGIPGAGRSIPMPGDYDGSGKTELAVYLPSLGLFAYRPAGGGPDVIEPFGIGGTGGSIPAPGDYDGDGKTDLAIYLPSLAEFAVRPSSGGADQLTPFGAAGAGQTLPVPALPGPPTTASASSARAESVSPARAATVVGSAIPSGVTTRRKALVVVAQEPVPIPEPGWGLPSPGTPGPA